MPRCTGPSARARTGCRAEDRSGTDPWCCTAAFLPQFLGSTSQHHLAKLIVLGAIFMLVTFAVFAVYAYASALLRERVLGAPVARQWFQGVLGSLLIGIGVRLAVADR